MAPNGSRDGKEKATARAKMPSSVMNQRLWFDRDCINRFISKHIRGLLQIYNVCGIKDDRVWDLIDDIIFLDPVTTCHFSQFQLMWPHSRSRSSPLREWWPLFRSYMAQKFDTALDQMNNWRWDNPGAIREQVNSSNPQTTNSGKDKRTTKRFSWYCSNDLRAMIEPPSCRQYKPGDFLAVRQRNWDEIIHKDDVDENWAHSGVPSGVRSRPSDGNDNDDCEGQEDTQGGEKGTGKLKGTNNGNGKVKGKATEEGKGKG
jgi:hypothetical protein